MILNKDIIKAIAAGVVLLGLFLLGFYVEHLRFAKYRTEVEAAAAQQQAKTELIVEQADKATKQVKDDYESKIDAIHSYYASKRVLDNKGSGILSSVSKTTSSVDGETSNSVLAEQCAVTTQMVLSLQDWITKQETINGK